ncbi:RNA polymerase subunit sigma, partial [Mesorhizobium sp. M4A.F.Ca.ET.022.05.2.1]
GLSYAQAAEVSGVPLGTLMSRIGRARAALREMEEAAPVGRNHLRIVKGER